MSTDSTIVEVEGELSLLIAGEDANAIRIGQHYLDELIRKRFNLGDDFGPFGQFRVRIERLNR